MKSRSKKVYRTLRRVTEPEIGLNDEVFESFRKMVKMTHRTRSISFNESDEENISDL